MAVEKLFAGLALALCIVMLLRMTLGAQRRARLDRRALQGWKRLTQWVQYLLHWRSRRESARQASQKAIRRAQHKAKGKWKGNVYTPDTLGSGDDPNKPASQRDLH